MSQLPKFIKNQSKKSTIVNIYDCKCNYVLVECRPRSLTGSDAHPIQPFTLQATLCETIFHPVSCWASPPYRPISSSCHASPDGGIARCGLERARGLGDTPLYLTSWHYCPPLPLCPSSRCFRLPSWCGLLLFGGRARAAIGQSHKSQTDPSLFHRQMLLTSIARSLGNIALHFTQATSKPYIWK